MAAYDYKKEYKHLYSPKTQPSIVQVEPAKFVAVRGMGNPNDENGTYKQAVGILYALSYTIRMSSKRGHAIEGFFEYTVPPLEGLWWMENEAETIDYSNKEGFCWIAMIRLPEFVTEEVFNWAKEEAARKKKLDTGCAELFLLDEGLCVQCMHLGSYDDEPETVASMDRFLEENGYRNDFSESRRHHEIYLNDPRRTAPEKLKTVIRHPAAKKI
ncbi:transcriptional regulator [Clostridium sp. MCC353]|uniref:GyrI-like domain-containing protein n=1 Tax=Clostridium sp. MCC353 TaxID=2592646 RepID=UPI001C033096|nr:GyrI-like domain-containing protein [Clostridium sp. MCC353]MBT9776521.1 transcriptional regulator [Clostridium sp. MCC353]